MSTHSEIDEGGLVSSVEETVAEARLFLKEEARDAARASVDDLLARAVAMRDRSRPGTFAKARGQRLVDKALETRSRIGQK